MIETVRFAFEESLIQPKYNTNRGINLKYSNIHIYHNGENDDTYIKILRCFDAEMACLIDCYEC